MLPRDQLRGMRGTECPRGLMSLNLPPRLAKIDKASRTQSLRVGFFPHPFPLGCHESPPLLLGSIVDKMIEEEIANGIPSSRIVLGGFSQGGAIALYGGLSRKDKQLGGIMGLSTYLPLQSEFPQHPSSCPVLLCHGDADDVITLKRAQQSAQFMQDHQVNLSFITYPGMPHSTSPQEIRDILSFLKKVVP